MFKRSFCLISALLMVLISSVSVPTASAADYVTYDFSLFVDSETNTATLTGKLPAGAFSGKLVVSTSDKLTLVAGSTSSINEDLGVFVELNESYNRDGVSGVAVAFTNSVAIPEDTVVFNAKYNIVGNANEITTEDFDIVIWNLSDGSQRLATQADGDVVKAISRNYTVTFVAGNGGALASDAVISVASGTRINTILPQYTLNDGYGFKSYSVSSGTVESDMTISLEFYLIGDVNMDGSADNLDAAFILRYDAMLITLDDDALMAADVNFDGDVNSLDAAAILKYDAGINGPFHYAEVDNEPCS